MVNYQKYNIYNIYIKWYVQKKITQKNKVRSLRIRSRKVLKGWGSSCGTATTSVDCNNRRNCYWKDDKCLTKLSRQDAFK